jgi:hypothetical protein
MYGAKYVGRLDGGTVPMERFVVKSSEVVTKGDWLSIDTAGLVDVAAADELLLGVANETVTGDGTKTVEVILALPGTKFLMDNDNDTETFAVEDQGELHAITGTTGIQQVDTNSDSEAPSNTVNQLLCLKYNPQGYLGGIYDADTSIGLYTPVGTYFVSNYTE